MDFNESKQYIAKKLGISSLERVYYQQDEQSFQIFSYWCAAIRFNKLDFFVSFIESDKWEKGFLIVYDGDDIQFTTCELLEPFTAIEKLHNVDIYPNARKSSTSHTIFNYTIEVKTMNSRCHFGTSGNVVNQNLRELASELLTATHIISEKGSNQKIKELLSTVLYSYS